MFYSTVLVNAFVSFVFHVLFRDIKIFSICHRVLGVPTIIWPSWGYRSSYTAYLKLHMLVIISSPTKAQEQTNPWLNILATIFLIEYISLYWTATWPISSCTHLLLSSLSQKPKNRPIPGLIFLPPFSTRIYSFELDSYMAYLKLHTLLPQKPKKQTNPRLKILATIFH